MNADETAIHRRTDLSGGPDSSDSLGYRGKFGVLVPSTNTSVQPEFDAMRPVGVTNHTARIVIPDDGCAMTTTSPALWPASRPHWRRRSTQ